MDLRIADTFTASLARLTGDEQKAAKTTAFDLQLNPANPGMSLHKLDRAKDKHFWSVRVSDDIRIIVHRTDASLLLCYVDHHDKAYQWAERRRLEVHPKTGAAQLVEIRERVQEIAVPKYVESVQPAPAQPLLFAGIAEETLLGYGVPREWLADVLGATEDSLLALTDHLPGEAAEALLELATGGTPKAAPVGVPEMSPFDHPDAQRRFRVMGNVEELERALNFPWDKWTVFLHPAQREWVERDYNGPARVSGSAGTGKTIVALHRAVYLARRHPEARVLLATFSDTLASALRTTAAAADRQRAASWRTVGSAGHGRAGGTALCRTVWPGADRFARTGSGFARDCRGGGGRREVQPAFPARRMAGRGGRLAARILGGVPGRAAPGPQDAPGRSAACGTVGGVRAGAGRLASAGLAAARATVQPAYPRPAVPAAAVRFCGDRRMSGHRRGAVAVALGGDRPNALFFAGDLGQRIFQQPFSWKALGVDIRGRARTLHVNYRTSHQIRRQADRLLGPQVADVDGNTEERGGTVSVFNGPAPQVASYADEAAEISAVAGWLEQRTRDGVPAHEIAVIVRSQQQVPRAAAALVAAQMPWRELDEHVDTQAGVAALRTMPLAKGLEFRAVAVMACDDEVIPLQQRVESIADAADLEEVYSTERHLLYVACTRARDQLLVTGVAPTSEFLDDLKATVG